MNQKLKDAIVRLIAFVVSVAFCLSGVSVLSYGAERNIDVWDFGFVAESADYYNNNITEDNLKSEIDRVGILNAGQVNAGTMNFGELHLILTAKDRFYNSLENTNYNYGSTGISYSDDDYTSNGIYYANGTGGESRRCVIIENVKKGDVLISYSGWSSSAESNLVCISGSFADGVFTADGVQNDASETFSANTKNTFIAKEDGAYKIYTNSDAGKPVFFRVMRVPSIAVSGTITGKDGDSANIPSSYGIKFRNETTKDEIDASVSNNTYTAALPAGFKYTAIMTGVVGYGFTVKTKALETQLSDVASGAITADLISETKEAYTLSGKFEGFAEDYDTSSLEAVFTPTDNDDAEEITQEIGSELSYSVQLEKDVTYAVSIKGVNDYQISSSGTVNYAEDATLNIGVETKPVYDVSGKFIGITDIRGVYEDLNITPSEIKFTNVDDNYSYTGTISGSAFSAKLRNGSYSVSITADDYITSNHIVVSDGSVAKDILCEYTGSAAAVAYASDIYVGSDKEYKTVTAAVNAVTAMGTRTENQRVKIHISPGTYREQIIINTPYVTLVNDSSSADAILTWYYGIGYVYYSCDETGYYSPYSDYDKYDKNGAERWGAAVYVKSGGTGFKAENIYFESSFNKYMTDEEIADGVKAVESNPSRTISSKVTDKTYTERAAALALDSDNNELYKCTLTSSQDTLYTGSGTCDSYFKNCKIIGQTDYIFGDGNVVFDGCELQWAGYSAGSTGGYLTAAKADSSYGYLFRGCTITGADLDSSKMTVKSGTLGRPWGAGAKVTYLDTKLAKEDYIANDDSTGVRWSAMSGVQPSQASFLEYNTTYAGSSVHTDVDSIDREKYNAVSYLGDFTPEHYSADLNTVPTFSVEPYFESNGDLNIPTIGNTFYAAYSLGNYADNDVSLISWYRVDENGERTLVKTTSTNISNSYQAQAGDSGYYIEFELTPITINGQTGKTFTKRTEHALDSNWVDPSNPNEPEPGSGINIFLAGDSTVKDYSTEGMYQSGKLSNEGSWGEFIQNYFNSDYVTINNYANGGRSLRNFMNEGSLAKIDAKISEGDYLFIQFGLNDSSNDYIDRYIPLVSINEDGTYEAPEGEAGQEVFPTVAPRDGYTVASLNDDGTITEGDLTYDCGATYNWYLKEYINVARKHNAIPVLVTTVSRKSFNSDGTISTHLDSEKNITGTYISSNDAYVRAVKQVAQEENVLLIDLFETTKTLYNETYAADSSASNGSSPLCDELFSTGDNTHSSKLGGMIQAGKLAKIIKDMNLDISNYIIVPKSCEGVNNNGTMFTVSTTSIFKAYGNDFNYSEYWTNYGQDIFDSLGDSGDSGDSGDDDKERDLGDANGDGEITQEDANELIKKIVNKETLTSNYFKAADVDGDGEITLGDALMILEKSINSNYTLPAEQQQ